jgi:membrane-associated PAP2 superfamily phosphatase
MMPAGAVLPLLSFMVLLLAAALCALAASGHFPREHRSPALRTAAGAFVLFGSLVVSMLCVAIGVALVGRAVPWYAVVIGGGAVVLAAPLLLRPLPDVFVNGRAALVTFAAASMLMLVLLLSTL